MANTTGMKNRTDEYTAQAEEKAASMADRAKEAVSGAADTVRETAGNVAHRAGEMASTAGHKADDAVSSTGGGMRDLADAIERKAPESGMLHTAGAAVADTLRKSGEYLESHGLSGVGDDVTNLIRRNPIPAMLVGIGLGFLIARATRS